MTDEMGVFETATGKPVPSPAGVGGRSESETLPGQRAHDDPDHTGQCIRCGVLLDSSEPGYDEARVIAGCPPRHRSAMENRVIAEKQGLPVAEDQDVSERVEGERAVSRTYGPGTWQRLRPGDELTLMLDDSAMHYPMRVPEREPVRIDYARTKAHTLGLPFSPELTLEEVRDGVRAVDALGRVGVYREQDRTADGQQRFLFVPEETAEQLQRTMQGAITGALAALTRHSLLEAGGHNEQDAHDAIEKAYDELRSKLCPSLPPRGAFGNDAGNPIYYYAPATWPRNGRETGAWIAGMASRQRFCRVRLLSDHVDGAVTSLVQAGMVVGQFTGPREMIDNATDEEAHNYSVLDVECPSSLAWSF